MKNSKQSQDFPSSDKPIYYEFCLNDSQKKIIRIKIALLSIITNGFLFGSLFFGQLSSIALYVFIPQFLSFIMGMVAIFFLLPFFYKEKNLQKKNVEDVTKATKGYYLSKIVLLLIAIIGRVICVVKTSGTYDFFVELILLILSVLFGGASVTEFITISHVSYKEKTPD